jgi:peptidoglycan/xylan/chitin deacetylase (PgdA/CDA1 family)
VLGAFPYRATNGNSEIALTFDDGRNEPCTTQLAELLSSRGIRATFFQVASNIERFPDTTRALLEAGHVIGNHSYSHHFTRCFRTRARGTFEKRSALPRTSLRPVSAGSRRSIGRPGWCALRRCSESFDAVRYNRSRERSVIRSRWFSRRPAASLTSRSPRLAPGR